MGPIIARSCRSVKDLARVRGAKGNGKSGYLWKRLTPWSPLPEGDGRVEGVQHLEIALTPAFSQRERGKKGSLSRQERVKGGIRIAVARPRRAQSRQTWGS